MPLPHGGSSQHKSIKLSLKRAAELARLRADGLYVSATKTFRSCRGQERQRTPLRERRPLFARPIPAREIAERTTCRSSRSCRRPRPPRTSSPLFSARGAPRWIQRERRTNTLARVRSDMSPMHQVHTHLVLDAFFGTRRHSQTLGAIVAARSRDLKTPPGLRSLASAPIRSSKKQGVACGA